MATSLGHGAAACYCVCDKSKYCREEDWVGDVCLFVKRDTSNKYTKRKAHSPAHCVRSEPAPERADTSL